MNQSQWALIDAMGISTWQRKEVGEITAPDSLHHTTGMVREVRFAVFVEQSDLTAHRALFQSILSAVNWPVQQIRILTRVEQGEALQQLNLKLVWCIGQFDIEASAAESIQSPSLAELASNPQLKSALWSQLKNYRHD